MIFKILVGQRKENYLGEFAPEALEVIDEFCDSENPKWMELKKNHFLLDKSFESVQVIEIQVNDKAIMSVLRPNVKLTGVVHTTAQQVDVQSKEKESSHE